MGSITSLKCVLTQEHLDAICEKYFVPEEVHPQLPSSDATMHERPAGKVRMYTRFFDYANYRIPFSTFFVSVLTHFRIPFSQLSVFGSAKVSHFEILCRVCNINPSVGLFRYFYTHNYKNGWFGFTKRPNVRACYSKNLDSVKNWNDHFSGVRWFVVPANARFGWFSGTNIVKDRAPAPSEYNVEHVNTLIAQASPFLRDGFEGFYRTADGPVVSVRRGVVGRVLESEFGEMATVGGGRSCSGFAAGSISAEEVTYAGLEEIYVPEWTVTKGFELNDGHSCANLIDHAILHVFFKTVRGMEHEQLFAEFNVSAARNLSLSSEGYNDLLEQERNVLRLQVASLESTVAEKDHELSDLEISSSSLRSQNQGLVSQVHELETSSVRLREQLDLYEENMKRLEEFQDNHYMRPLETRLAEIDADFTSAIEKGMQEGLAAGIEHGQAGRCLTDLEAYIPSAEVDFNSAVCDLRGLDFPLLQELSNKKDASTWDVMDLLRLDNAVAEALGMTDLQPDVSQLMVPVHHKQDRVVIGSQALSVALDICRGRVEKMERNLVERLPLLKDVFVSLDHPLSAEALIEPPVVVPATNALSTVVIVPHSGPSVSVEDYENPDLVDVVPKNVTLGPEGEENIDASTGGDPAFSRLENEARDVVL
ncbi:hypothetical protein Tco_0857148 [Tanacetum coccineum]|uniref:Transposase (putative) gypsy type domain-containing protein n=1 Tax=Tanacetum coccineum TaxID=301880 RepID=A0ABQ5B654_9ASTR